MSYGVELPTAHHTMAPSEASSTFLRRILDVFFAETVPTSSMANPVCIFKFQTEGKNKNG